HLYHKLSRRTSLEPISIATLSAAGISTVLSAFTFWFVFLHRGKVKMTQPTLLFLGRDGDGDGQFKVFLRSSLFSTSKRGHIIENMFATLSMDDDSHSFAFWAHRTDDSSRIVRGSGLAATENGIACDHHFVLSKQITTFELVPGKYTVNVHAKLVGRNRTVKLGVCQIEITESDCLALRNRDNGIYFDLEPDGNYSSHIETRPNRRFDIGDMATLIANGRN
ncbi:MAG: hypothetical protein AAGA30_13010, partial [Planctomycetota bacterium]